MKDASAKKIFSLSPSIQHLAPLTYPVASGILYALSFPRIELSVAGWVCLVPLLIAIRNETPRRSFYRGWLAGGVACLGLLDWVSITMEQYGKLPYLATLPILLLLVAYLGVYWAGFAALLTWIRSRWPWDASAVMLPPLLWTTLEWVRAHALTGFPWALLGYSQYRNLALIQMADLAGIYGVSFLMVLVNAAIAEAFWIGDRRGRRSALISLLVAFLALGLTWSYGQWRLSRVDPALPEAPTRSLRVGVVQGNIPQDVKWDVRFRQATLQRYAQLTHGIAEQGLDLVVWPEAAMPFLFEDDLFFRQQILSVAENARTPLLFGSPARSSDPNKTTLTNSAYLLDASGQVVSRYDKIHLVPFGEYVPLPSILFFIDKMVHGIGDFAPGTDFTIFPLPLSTLDPQLSTHFGVVICFEVIFPELVRRFVQEGADLMVTITNDAWFGRSSAPYQHFSMVVFRSVENRVPFVRAANTGISGFIEASGRIRKATDLFTEAALTDTVRPSGQRTFYSRVGDLFADVCGIITVVLILFRIRAPRQDKENPQ